MILEVSKELAEGKLIGYLVSSILIIVAIIYEIRKRAKKREEEKGQLQKPRIDLKRIPNPLNREVIKLCREGRTLEAVKLVHEKTGLDLKRKSGIR